MEEILKAFAAFMLVILGVVILIYILIGIFLNKFNKIIYGKGTPMAWIPIFNIYLLGKLTINKFAGIILVVCNFLTSTFTVTVNGKETVYTFLPENVSKYVTPVYGIVLIVLLIYAIIKYNKIKKDAILEPKILADLGNTAQDYAEHEAQLKQQQQMLAQIQNNNNE